MSDKFVLIRRFGFLNPKLLVARGRYVSVAPEKNSVEITLTENQKIRKILAESYAENKKVENRKVLREKLIGKRITFLGNGIFSVC